MSVPEKLHPLDELQAATAKLEKLKADSAQGVWGHWPEAGDIEIFATKDGHPNGGSFHVIAAQVRPGAGYGAPIYSDNYEPNAELIVALHATINAQLAILATALHRWRYSEVPIADELALARAINGAK